MLRSGSHQDDTPDESLRSQLPANYLNLFLTPGVLPSDHLKEGAVADEHTELLQGTLEMLVLKTLAFEPMHGWGIAHRIERMSNDVFLVAQGSLYPALVRMKRRGWVKTEWRVTENSRRARYYQLTAPGRRQLDVHYTTWQRASAAVNGIMTGQWTTLGAES